ncbi:MAG: hypothetical protein IJY73_04310 [Oscillospiraceae bacterium]|nr:hypothetical protein [Oscillospiraceae bacterium]
MADLSLDDILAEIDSKRSSDDSGKTAPEFSVDDILGETLGDIPKRKSYSSSEKTVDRKPKEKKLIVAAEKTEAQKKAEEKAKKLAEERAERERKLAAEKAERERKAAAERAEKERKLLEAAEAKRKAEEEAMKKRQAQLEEEKRKAELQRRKAEEEEAERKRAIQEKERREAEEAARIAALAAEEQEAARKEAERLRREQEESEKRFATKNIVFEEAPIEIPKFEEEPQEEKAVPATTEEIELEKEVRRVKAEEDVQKRLEREMNLEDPDDFLTAFNPMDTGEKPQGLTQMIETIPAAQLSGDTVGIAGNDLKEIARANTKIAEREIEDIVSGDTIIMPELRGQSGSYIDLDKTFVLGDTNEIAGPYVPQVDPSLALDTMELGRSREETTAEIPAKKAEQPRKKKKIDDPLLASINRTIEQKRLDDIAAQSTRSVTEQLEKASRTITQTNGFLIEIDRASMPQTGHIPVSNPVVGEQKLKSLASKKKRRITDFVLEDITDDDDFSYGETEEEFDASDDDGQVWEDLTETHKSLRLRFILLLIVTVILTGIVVLQEFSVNFGVNILGEESNFLNKRYFADGFIYFNLIAGVIGMGLCSSAIVSGITKLFKGKADCDTTCALSCVLSLIGAVLHLSNPDDLQRGNAFIFIPVALVGLLFNTLGKLSMISRARKNFRFIAADENRFYADMVEGESEVSAFTKGVVHQLPVLATMRKTEYITDFLRKSYCEDKADRISRFLAPASLIGGVILGLLAYFIPNGIDGLGNNIFWASSAAIGFVTLFAPFSIMFIVNNPLRRATKSLLKSGSTVLGYSTAEEFSETNAIITDVSAIFPISSVVCTNMKPCKLQNSINNITLDQSIILAASLAIKCNSILSRLFFEMIGGKKEMLADIDGVVFEDNMGVMGWYGNKRLIMGNREHMKHHSIKVPELSAIAKYSRGGSEAVYLAVGGELAIIFFVRLTANPNIRNCLCDLTDRGVSLIVKTTDSLISAAKIADLFDIDPEKVKVIGSNLHEIFTENTKYTSRGSGGITCNGSFLSFGRAILASKKLVNDVSLSQTIMLLSVFLAAVFAVILALSVKTLVFSPAVIIGYNLLWMVPVLLVQAFRKY